MAEERKVILYIAQSLDGFIAQADDDISWLSVVERENEDYGYEAFIKTVDTVFMGRRTYEKVLSFDMDFHHKDRKCYVLSRSKSGQNANVTFYSGELSALINRLKAEPGPSKHIFVDGGAEVVKAFREEGLIDEYVISIIPIMLGRGIRLFKDIDVESKVELVDHKVFASGLVQLTYRCIKKV